MKNTIIVILSLICAFLIANTIGVFDFMSLSNHDETEVYRKKREHAVHTAKTYKLVYPFNGKDLSNLAELYGYQDAIEEINQTAEKKFELILHDDVTTIPQNSKIIQKYNDDYSVTAILAPVKSAYIPSSRALASMYSMPLISTTTFRSEKLAPLEMDTYLAFYPVLEKWIETIGNHVQENKLIDKMLIIGPEKGSFGDIFATAMERYGTANLNLDRIYRVNFNPPLKRNELVDQFKFLKDEDIDCILFTGYYDDFLAFQTIAEEYFPKAEIYGTDSL